MNGITACLCEHPDHGPDGHHALAGPHMVAMHVGPVCESCANDHVAEYLRQCDSCGQLDHWTADHPVALPCGHPLSCHRCARDGVPCGRHRVGDLGHETCSGAAVRGGLSRAR